MTPVELRLGLIGCGTVGSAFLASFEHRRSALETITGVRLRLTRIAVRHPERRRRDGPHGLFTDDAAGVAGDAGIDIVVEASGAPDAASWIQAALSRGAAVVTANKQALARDPRLLAALASGNPRLHCEGAVAAAVPIVRALRDSLSGEEIHAIRGVLNGTTTFVLGRIEQHRRFDDAVREAQAAGYAEANPTEDLDGSDSGAKLAILSSIAWREPVPIQQVRIRGIDSAVATSVAEARARRRRVRLVASAVRTDRVHAVVEPRFLADDDPLASGTGVHNVVQVRAALAGTLTWHGAGAGGRSTASALLGDTIAAARAVVARAVVARERRTTTPARGAPARPAFSAPITLRSTVTPGGAR